MREELFTTASPLYPPSFTIPLLCIPPPLYSPSFTIPLLYNPPPPLPISHNRDISFSCCLVYLLLSLLRERSSSGVAPLSSKSFVVSRLLDSITHVLPNCLNGEVISEIERRRGHMRGRRKNM